MSGETLRNNTEKHRYELLDEGRVVCIVEYDLDGDTVVFRHTEVSEGHEGKGYASRLAKMALDDVLAGNRKIAAHCEFISGFVRRHPEYVAALKTG